MEYRVVRDENYIAHHGILGQKWGKRNGPPYPLGADQHSAREKKAGYESSIAGKSLRLSPGAKKAIIIGAAVVATGLAAWGGYTLAKSGKLDEWTSAGRSALKGVSPVLGGEAGDAYEAKETVLGGLPKTINETIESSLANANPLKGTPESQNNCGPSSIAGILRTMGVNATAKASPNYEMVNLAGVVEECFNFDNRNANIKEGSAVVFGKSPEAAGELLKKRFGDNARGVCRIPYGAGHNIAWIIENGKTSFYDFQYGQRAESLWSGIKLNGDLQVCRLDNAVAIADKLAKYVDIA